MLNVGVKWTEVKWTDRKTQMVWWLRGVEERWWLGQYIIPYECLLDVTLFLSQTIEDLADPSSGQLSSGFVEPEARYSLCNYAGPWSFMCLSIWISHNLRKLWLEWHWQMKKLNWWKRECEASPWLHLRNAPQEPQLSTSKLLQISLKWIQS